MIEKQTHEAPASSIKPRSRRAIDRTLVALCVCFARPAVSAPEVPPVPCSAVLGTQAQAVDLAEAGKQCLGREDWAAAIGLYTKLLQQPDSSYHQQALEMLGVARLRNGQPARAKTEFEKYLQLYPKSDGAERVRQRLEALDTADAQPKPKLEAPSTAQNGNFWETYGSFSQYYFRDTLISDTRGDVVDQSLFLSNLNLTSKLRSDRFDVRAQLDARYRENFLPVRYNQNDQLRVSNLFVDLADRQTGLSTRLGRQSRASGGVMGRFDGGVVSYRFAPQWQINAVGGFPVYAYRSTAPNTQKSFEGVSLDFGPFADYWAGNAFFINQTDQGKLDRRAIGGEGRYQHPVHPVFTLLDYDVYFNALNTAQVLANWNFDNGAILSIAADYRKTPYLSTSNALIGWGSGFGPGTGAGSGASTIRDILFYQPSIDLKQVAEDNTSTLKTASINGVVPITDKLRFNGDITITDLSATKGSIWVTPYQGSGVQQSYSAQLIASSLFTEGDVWNLGARYSTQKTSDVISVFLDGRYPVSPDLRLDPRLRVDYFTGFDGSDVYRIRPGLRVNYRVVSKLYLELESGYEYSNKPLFEHDSNSMGYYISAGYRWDF